MGTEEMSLNTPMSQASLDLDERVAHAARRTAQILQRDIEREGLSKVGEMSHLRPAFVASLTNAGVADVQLAGKQLPVHSWTPVGTAGKLGAFDVLVGTAPHYRAFFELKWAYTTKELGWTLWDIYKLIAARLEYGVRAYGIVGARTAHWEDDSVDCSALYCNGVWDSQELFRRYEGAWRDLLDGGTARPVRIPTTIETRVVATERLQTEPSWELRALAIDVPGFDWLEFDGEWPNGHHVAADA